MRELLRAAVKTGGGSAGTVLMGVVAVKVLAVLAGPNGVGFFSLLRQTQQTALIAAILNGQTALIQGIASRKGEERARFISVAFWLIAGATIVVALAFLLAPGAIARLLTGRVHPEATAAVRFLALSIFLGAIALFSTGVLSGHRMVGRAAAVGFANFAALAALSYPFGKMARDGTPLAFAWLLNAGALAGAVAGVAFVFRIVKLRRPSWTSEDRAAAKQFLAMAATMIAAMVGATALPLFIRGIVTRGFGFSGAGIFDVAWTVSLSYLLILITSFTSYYLPALAGITDPAERVAMIRGVLRFAVMISFPVIAAVVVLKPLLIVLLYSPEFADATTLLRWMLIGDCFRVMSWVFASTLLAYRDLKTYFWTEVVCAAVLAIGSWISVRWLHSLEGIGVTFLIVSGGYFLFMLAYVRRRFAFSFPRRAGWLGVALLIVLAASAASWNDVAVRWPVAAVTLLAGAACSWMIWQSRYDVSVQ